MTPSLTSGGIMKFAKVRLSCLGCKSPLADGETSLCKHCRHKVCCIGCMHNLLGYRHMLASLPTLPSGMSDDAAVHVQS